MAINLHHDVTQSTKATAHINSLHLVQTRRNIYTALEDMDFTWSMSEVEKFDEYWNAGVALATVARILERDADECAILAMDRARQGKIHAREYGVYGGVAE